MRVAGGRSVRSAGTWVMLASVKTSASSRSRSLRCLVALVALVFAIPLASRAEAAPATYALDGARSSFVAHLLKGGLAKGFAHDHVLRAKQVRGSVTLSDAARLETATIEITVDTRTLDVDPSKLRKAYGMKEALSAKDRAKVKKNLEDKDQLWVARYPELRFVSTGLRALGGERYAVSGKLTIRGVTRAVQLSVKAKLKDGGRTIEGQGQLRFKQSDYGYKPYSAGLGLVKVRDPVTLNLYLVARRP